MGNAIVVTLYFKMLCCTTYNVNVCLKIRLIVSYFIVRVNCLITSNINYLLDVVRRLFVKYWWVSNNVSRIGAKLLISITLFEKHLKIVRLIVKRLDNKAFS